jgi:hypothetical protein
VHDFLVKENNLAADTYGLLHHLYGDSCMGAFRRWVKHFNNENTDIIDHLCCGRPRSTTTKCKEQKVDAIIKED